MHKTLQKRFYEDSEWHQVEELIMSYITPLLDMTSVDTSQPAEHVKAEIVGRRIAYDKLLEFVEQSKLVTKPREFIKSPFR